MVKIIHFYSNSARLEGKISIKKDKPLVILCHGLSGSKEGKTYKDLFASLKKHFSVFAFDFYGHGNSEGKFFDAKASICAQNLRSAIDYCLSHYALPQPVGIFGNSLGAFTAMLEAADDSRINCLVLGSLVFDFRDKNAINFLCSSLTKYRKKRFTFINVDSERKKLSYDYYSDAINQPIKSSVRKISCPTLIIHGSADTTVSVEQHALNVYRLLKCRKSWLLLKMQGTVSKRNGRGEKGSWKQ